MKTKDFLKKHEACIDGAEWALSIGEDMVDVWEALIREGEHEWLVWTATRPEVFPDAVLRKLACRFIRETPLLDGRKVWDLLTDERSRNAVEVVELYANGKATDGELQAAYAAAAAYAARAAYDTDDAAEDAAYAAAFAAARAAACDAACAADAAAYAATDAAACAADAAAYAATDAAAFAATDAAYDATDAAYDAVCVASNAAYDDASAAAKAAQIKMIAERGNPFKERTGR